MSRTSPRTDLRPPEDPPGPIGDAPSSRPRVRARERGRARRRLRFLRRAREVQLRDLGGFALELYRFGEQRDGLVREKLEAIIATDQEIHALEDLLGTATPVHEVRRADIGGRCPSCGALHATRVRFCSQCGADLAARPAAEAEPTPAAPSPSPQPVDLPNGDVTIVRRADDPGGAEPDEAVQDEPRLHEPALEPGVAKR